MVPRSLNLLARRSSQEGIKKKWFLPHCAFYIVMSHLCVLTFWDRIFFQNPSCKGLWEIQFLSLQPVRVNGSEQIQFQHPVISTLGWTCMLLTTKGSWESQMRFNICEVCIYDWHILKTQKNCSRYLIKSSGSLKCMPVHHIPVPFNKMIDWL